MTQTGVLLINLGTPDGKDIASVRRYLRQFLKDPHVVDLPTLPRWILANMIALLRGRQSAHAYQQIWTEQGSPLLINMRNLCDAVADCLGKQYKVALGMRYGHPDIAHAVSTLSHCKRIIVLPMFPQYSNAATGSAIAEFNRVIKKQANKPEIIIYQDFHQHPLYIDAYVNNIKNAIQNQSIDMLIFSYHGLPERHITKSICQAACDHANECPAITQDNVLCYRAQCYATSRLLAQQLQMQPNQYRVAFQSRLGKLPWIKPYIDQILPDLIAQGCKNIAIVSPSFVSDCLETLEEINIRLREQWKALGGSEFIVVPCLNDNKEWIASIVEIIVNQF